MEYRDRRRRRNGGKRERDMKKSGNWRENGKEERGRRKEGNMETI